MNHPHLMLPVQKVTPQTQLGLDTIAGMMQVATDYKIQCIAANQVGIPLALLVGSIKGKWTALANPELVIDTPEAALMWIQVCPHTHKRFAVRRHPTCRVKYINEHGEKDETYLKGVEAVHFQNAIACLHGQDLGFLHKLGDWG